MKLEDVTAEIRPRSDWEAVDLGFAMTRRDFWRCLVIWWLPLLLPLGIVGWFLRDYPLLLAGLVWWLQPIGSRMVLFELSRRLFGEKPSWKAIFKELPKVWYRRFFYRLIWARLSPWLPVMLAVEDLEGVRGKIYRQRASQLARRGDGAVMWVYFLGGLAGLWLAVTFFGTAVMLMPEGQEVSWKMAWDAWDQAKPMDVPPLIGWTTAICSVLGVSLTDLFVTGAGFGIYVNNRTWLEGWDVELAFKRLGVRLGKIAAVVSFVFLVFGSSPARAQGGDGTRTDAEVIKEVKADPDFQVHSITYKVPKPTKAKASPSTTSSPRTSHGRPWSFTGIPELFMMAAVGMLLCLLGLLIWKFRHMFTTKGGGGGEAKAAPQARVVMGMEVTAESLPKNIPDSAWELWQQGRRQEAMGLLYRGTISKVIDVGQADIQESDTEGDCLKRVESAGPSAHPGYFKSLTGTWIRLAYAGMEPPEVEVRALCSDWPFRDGRKA